MFCQPVNIPVGEDGGSGFAAIGARKAADLCECFIMKPVDFIIQVFREVIFQLGEKLVCFPLRRFRLLSEVF